MPPVRKGVVYRRPGEEDPGMLSDADRGIAELAQNQHGQFNRKQVCAVGGDDPLIERRLEQERWLNPAPGVYGLHGFPRTWRQSLMIAVLTAGDDALVAVHAAAALQGLETFPACTPVLLAPHGDHHRVRNALLHQSRALPPHHRTVVHGIPVTTVARTIFDLSAHLTRRRLAHVLDCAVRDRKVTLEEVKSVSAELAKRGRKGSARMRSVLAERTEGWVPPESLMDTMFEKILVTRGIRLPLKQRPFPGRETLGHRSDWSDPAPENNIFELDGRRWHMRVEDFERDRKRDREAHLLGHPTYRFTYWELRDAPEEVAATVVEARKFRMIRVAS